MMSLSPIGCFNEAEARAPRMPVTMELRPDIFPGFNEAEARAPRMLALGAIWDFSSAPCFNEAEARAPRMLDTGGVLRGLFRSFNEAEARAPRMPINSHAVSASGT